MQIVYNKPPLSSKNSTKLTLWKEGAYCFSWRKILVLEVKSYVGRETASTDTSFKIIIVVILKFFPS